MDTTLPITPSQNGVGHSAMPGAVQAVAPATSHVPVPAVVKVGLYNYTIHTDEATRQYLNAKNRIGEHDAYATKLSIDSTQAPESSKETLIHELLHALWYQLDMDGFMETFKASTLDHEKVEEHIIHLLSPLLTQVLVDNPGLLAYLGNRG